MSPSLVSSSTRSLSLRVCHGLLSNWVRGEANLAKKEYPKIKVAYTHDQLASAMNSLKIAPRPPGQKGQSHTAQGL